MVFKFSFSVFRSSSFLLSSSTSSRSCQNEQNCMSYKIRTVNRCRRPWEQILTFLTCSSRRSRKARWAARFCSLRFKRRASSWNGSEPKDGKFLRNANATNATTYGCRVAATASRLPPRVSRFLRRWSTFRQRAQCNVSRLTCMLALVRMPIALRVFILVILDSLGSFALRSRFIMLVRACVLCRLPARARSFPISARRTRAAIVRRWCHLRQRVVVLGTEWIYGTHVNCVGINAENGVGLCSRKFFLKHCEKVIVWHLGERLGLRQVPKWLADWVESIHGCGRKWLKRYVVQRPLCSGKEQAVDCVDRSDYVRTHK